MRGRHAVDKEYSSCYTCSITTCVCMIMRSDFDHIDPFPTNQPSHLLKHTHRHTRDNDIRHLVRRVRLISTTCLLSCSPTYTCTPTAATFGIVRRSHQPLCLELSIFFRGVQCAGKSQSVSGADVSRVFAIYLSSSQQSVENVRFDMPHTTCSGARIAAWNWSSRVLLDLF